jgi:hypothetical protein
MTRHVPNGGNTFHTTASLPCSVIYEWRATLHEPARATLHEPARATLHEPARATLHEPARRPHRSCRMPQTLPHVRVASLLVAAHPSGRRAACARMPTRQPPSPTGRRMYAGSTGDSAAAHAADARRLRRLRLRGRRGLERGRRCPSLGPAY